MSCRKEATQTSDCRNGVRTRKRRSATAGLKEILELKGNEGAAKAPKHSLNERGRAEWQRLNYHLRIWALVRHAEPQLCVDSTHAV